MNTLQEQVDQLKDENRQKQLIIEQLMQQVYYFYIKLIFLEN